MNKKELIIFNLEKLKKIYIEDENKKWNLRAISMAINSIKIYDKEIVNGDQLKKEIKGIGDKISKKVDEILKTGTLQELNKKLTDLDNLLLITGIGIVRAKKWNSLGLNNINDVRNAILEKKITTTHHIDIGIKYYEDFQLKVPREEIDTIKSILEKTLKKIDNGLIFEICGSYRRGLLESGDIDILISHSSFIENISNENFLKKIIKELTKINIIIDNLTINGNTKFMGVCKINKIARRIDIRVVNFKSYFSSIIYFTGSKNFNIYIRNIALEKKYSLNEYGLTDLETNNFILLNDEKEIFKILNIEYLNPNERNNF